MLEILAARLLAPYVGVSLETYTAIIGTAIIGTAIIGTVLAGIAVGAWRAGGAAGIGGTLVLTSIGFLTSATVAGAVPPAVVELQLRDLGDTGATVGRLSAYGTAGAIVATFLTGFVLVAVTAVTTIIISVGVVLVVSGPALWMALPRIGSRAVPWHLATEEFVTEVQRGLRPTGLYALNVIDGAQLSFLRAETVTIASVFSYVQVVLSASAADGRIGNAVIVASDRPFDAERLDPEDGRLVDGIETFIDGAKELTDDFAPVDQLLTGAS